MSSVVRFWRYAILWVVAAGCASPAAERKQPASEHAAPPTAAAPIGDPASAASPTAPVGEGTAATPPAAGTPPASESLPVEAQLPVEVNAGVIPRASLRAVLSLGIGRFLQYVHAEPDVIKGHFAGWRITSLFADVPDVHVLVLRPGDTVRRANGQSIEHPEDFKVIWDSLANAGELVLDIERAGRPSKLRYTIAD